MRRKIIHYKKSGEVRGRIYKAAKELFLQYGYDQVRLSDIAEKCCISKGTVLYHFISKDKLFSQIICEAVTGEMQFLADKARAMPPDYGLVQLFSAMFTKNKSEYIQHVFDNKHLWEKSHYIIDQVRRDIVMPVFQRLVADGMKEGLLNITDPEITGVIIGYGIEQFIHNNHKRIYEDRDFYRRFLNGVSVLCNKTLKPSRIQFNFISENNININNK